MQDRGREADTWKNLMSNLTILYSGGLDSYIAYFYARAYGYVPELVYVDLGHPYAEKEKRAIGKNGLPCTMLDFSSLYPAIKSRLSNQIIPSRNLLFAVLGGMVNERVWIGALDGEQNGKERDKSERFFQLSTELLTYINNFFQARTIVESPFAQMTKSEVIAWGVANGVPKEKLFDTVSCYDPVHDKCGECLTCYKRYTAFLLNDLEEPGYNSPPLTSDYAREMEHEIPRAAEHKDYSRFTKRRIAEHMELMQAMK